MSSASCSSASSASGSGTNSTTRPTILSTSLVNPATSFSAKRSLTVVIRRNSAPRISCDSRSSPCASPPSSSTPPSSSSTMWPRAQPPPDPPASPSRPPAPLTCIPASMAPCQQAPRRDRRTARKHAGRQQQAQARPQPLQRRPATPRKTSQPLQQAQARPHPQPHPRGPSPPATHKCEAV